MGQSASLTLHATTIAVAGRAALITGRSGAGKSALAMQILAQGGHLIADDQTRLERQGGVLIASCPNPALKGLIEARGVGILQVPHLEQAELTLIVDLDRVEPDRLPPRRETVILDVALPLVLRPQNDHLAVAILLWLRGGRQE